MKTIKRQGEKSANTWSQRGAVNGEAMVLGGDVALSRSQIHAGIIQSSVPMLHPEDADPGRPGQDQAT